jgi:hypothetical protein
MFNETGGEIIATYSNSQDITSTTTWYNLVFTYNGNSNSSGIIIYKNGSAISLYRNGATISGDIRNTTPVLLGNSVYNTTNDLNGTIDEVAFFSSTLTSTQVTELYNSGAGLFY